MLLTSEDNSWLIAFLLGGAASLKFFSLSFFSFSFNDSLYSFIFFSISSKLTLTDFLEVSIIFFLSNACLYISRKYSPILLIKGSIIKMNEFFKAANLEFFF